MLFLDRMSSCAFHRSSSSELAEVTLSVVVAKKSGHLMSKLSKVCRLSWTYPFIENFSPAGLKSIYIYIYMYMIKEHVYTYIYI